MTQTDLFLSKSEQLENWMRIKGYFSKAEIMAWGLRNYYLRADRTVRDFVQEGKVKRISHDECVFRGLKGKMAWYCWNEIYVDNFNKI